MSTTQLVGIYTLYRLGRMNGKEFNSDIRVKDRDLHPVHHSFAEESNANSSINGLLYVEDKEATKLYWAKKPYDKPKEFTEFEDVKEEVKGTPEPLTEDLTGIVAIKNKLSEMTKEQLIEFADKNEYKVTKTKGAEKMLLEIIEQIKVEE